MTSPKFSADKFAAKNDLKRSFSRVIIPSLISFFLSFYILVINTYDTIISNTGLELKSRFRFILFSATVNGYIVVPILMICVGVLFAFVSFYQINRKNSVNFYFSSSIDRRTYFKNRTLASVSMMALTAFVPVLCDVIMNIHYFSHADLILYQGLLLFLEHFVNMFIGFSLMSISMMACYTITESLVFGAGIIWFPTLLIYSVNYIAQTFLRGFDQSIELIRSSTYDVSNILLNKLSIVNPVLFGKALGDNRIYSNIYYASYRPAKAEYSEYFDANTPIGIFDYSKTGLSYIAPIVIWLLFSVVFILIAEKLILNRKLENTALHASRPFINLFVAFEVSAFAIGDAILFGNDVEAISKNKFLLVLLALAVGFVVYYAFISISRRSIKHSPKFIIPGVATVVLGAVAVIICSAGAFGYATYAPKLDKIEYASVTSCYLDASGVISNDSFYENSAFDVTTMYLGGDAYIGKYTSKEGIEKIGEIQKSAYENEAKTKTISPTVKVFYRLKSGREITRSFNNTDIKIQNEILALTETKEYKDELEFLMSSKRAQEKSSGNYNENRNVNTNFFSSFDIESDVKYGLQNARAFLISKDAFTKTEIENTPALRDAILDDLENVGYEKILNSKTAPLGAIDLKYDDTVNNYKGNVYASDNTYYIYDCMTSTLTYLKSIGKLDALSDTSSLGNAVYVIAVKSYDLTGYDDTSFDSTRFTGGNINTSTYLDSTGDDFSEKALLETYNPKNNGKVIKDKKKIEKLFNASSIFAKCENDSYILLFKYDNGIYLSRYLSKENAQKYLK